MAASRETPPRFFLPMVLFVLLVLGFLPAPVAPLVSYAEVVSLFDEIDPPTVRSAAIPTPWQDDVYTGGVPAVPWSDDSIRKVRFALAVTSEKMCATRPVLAGDAQATRSPALGLLTESLLLGRPPPPVVSRTG